jgi:site-specific DNA recombinase
MVRTGKGGRYRYYACASHRLKGKTACSDPAAIPEQQLDELVLTALSGQLMTPERLPVLLQEARKHQRAMTSGNLQRRAALKKRMKELDAQAGRFYGALRDGVVTDTGLFRSQLGAIEHERDECIHHLSRLDADAPAYRQALSRQQATTLAAALQRRLLDAPKPLKRRYVQGLVSDIIVNREKAIITGPRAAIAATVTAGDLDGAVRTSVREWRARQDSNL